MQAGGAGTGRPQPCQPSSRPQRLARLTQGPMGAQSEAQGICPTLGDPMREVLSLQPEGGGVADAHEAAGPGAWVAEKARAVS